MINFIKNQKIYVGPLTDSQLDKLKTLPELTQSGIACSATKEKIEMFLTIPDDIKNKEIINKIKFMDIA